MARRFKPTSLKIIQGSKRIPRQPEPEAPGTLTDPPAWLSEAQKESWRYAVQHAPPGLLRQIDGAILAVWCCAEATLREASEQVERHGLLVKGPDGTPLTSPFLHIRNRQMLVLMRASAELGFSPASRAGVAASSGRADNPFSQNGRRPDPAV